MLLQPSRGSRHPSRGYFSPQAVVVETDFSGRHTGHEPGAGPGSCVCCFMHPPPAHRLQRELLPSLLTAERQRLRKGQRSCMVTWAEGRSQVCLLPKLESAAPPHCHRHQALTFCSCHPSTSRGLEPDCPEAPSSHTRVAISIPRQRN